MDGMADIAALAPLLADEDWAAVELRGAEGVLETPAVPGRLHDMLQAMPGVETTVVSSPSGQETVIYDADGDFLDFWSKNRRKLAKLRSTSGKQV